MRSTTEPQFLPNWLIFQDPTNELVKQSTEFRFFQRISWDIIRSFETFSIWKSSLKFFLQVLTISFFCWLKNGDRRQFCTFVSNHKYHKYHFFFFKCIKYCSGIRSCLCLVDGLCIKSVDSINVIEYYQFIKKYQCNRVRSIYWVVSMYRVGSMY